MKAHQQHRELEIALGVESKPLFESKEAYLQFRESFIIEAAPQLEACMRAQHLSAKDSMSRIVD